MSHEKRYLDRNDIARMLETTVDVVTRNEAALGIAPAKIHINARNIRYHATIAIRGMKAKGIIPKDE